MDYPYTHYFTLEPSIQKKKERYAKWQIRPNGKSELFQESNQWLTEEIVFDFDNIVIGSVLLEVSGEGMLEVRYGEYTEELFAPKELELSWYRFPCDSFQIHQECSLTSSGRRAFRYLRLIPSGKIMLKKLAALHEEYPLQKTFSFQCSDHRLNDIWSLCANTTRLCMHDYYEDGVKRDTFLWIGDARVQAQCGYRLFGDTELARRSLRMIANSQRRDGAVPACAARGCDPANYERVRYLFRDHDHLINSIGSWMLCNYMADFISFVWEYYCNSRDLETVRQLFPFVLRTSEYLMESCPPEKIYQFDFITDENPFQRNSWIGCASVYLCQLYGSLKDLEKLCDLMGQQKAEISLWKKRVCSCIHKDYIKEGLMIEPARGEYPQAVYYAAQAFAVKSGIFTQEEGRKAFEALKKREDAQLPVAGFMWFWTLDGMFQAGLQEEALFLIRQCWGYMLDHSASACWEKLDLKHPEKFTSDRTVSHCHGWSAGPAVLFQRYLLETIDTGKKDEYLNLMGLDWIEGTFPTQEGEVYLHREKGRLPVRRFLSD